MSLALIITFAMGPLLNFYVDTIYAGEKRYSKLFVIHFLPFLLALFFFSIPLAYTNWMQDLNSLDSRPVYIYSIPILGIISLAIYLRLLFRKLRNYGSQVKNNYASLEAKDLAWLRIWLRGTLVFVILDIGLGILMGFFPSLNALIYLNIAYMLGLIVYVGYSGIHQNQVFMSETHLHSVSNKAVKKVGSSNLGNLDNSPLKQQVIDLFEKEEIHLKEGLSLNDVAVRLDESPKKITELLNSGMNTNFYALVNHYRVAAFKKKLTSEEDQHKTFLGLAYESGFTSKATFNRAFKDITGMTPKAFQSSIEK